MINALNTVFNSFSTVSGNKSTKVQTIKPLTNKQYNANPFQSNIYLNNQSGFKNNPIQGGFFAGYYNGKMYIS